MLRFRFVAGRCGMAPRFASPIGVRAYFTAFPSVKLRGIVPRRRGGPLSGKPVETESGLLPSVSAKFGGVVAAVLQQLNPRQGGAEPHVERLPGSGFVQRGAHAPGGVTQKADRGHAGQPPAFPQNQTGMQMADDGLLNLRQLAAHDLLTPKKGERGRIVTEEQDALRRFERGKPLPDFGEMLFAQLCPLGPFFGERVRHEHGQGYE